MQEKDAQRNEIDDMEPAVFDSLLHLVYIDSLSDDADKNGEIRKKKLGEIIIKILNKKGLKIKILPISTESCRRAVAASEGDRCHHRAVELHQRSRADAHRRRWRTAEKQRMARRDGWAMNLARILASHPLAP